MNAKVENGIPIPPRKRRHTGVTDVLRSLEPGQSVELAIGTRGIWGIMRHVVKRYGYRFTTRTTPKGVRVWRTA